MSSERRPGRVWPVAIAVSIVVGAGAWLEVDAHETGEPHSGEAAEPTAEAEPEPRVRVCRAEMKEGVVVKEMSEATVLQRLERDLKALEARLR